MDKQYSFPKSKIKILLLERVHPLAEQALRQAGYSVETEDRALSSDELLDRIPHVHVLGVRSKTEIRKNHLAAAKRLLSIGSFGVGTNHIDLEAAGLAGVPVFNAPYGNTRSVAELAICNILSLARRSADKNNKMHQGIWDKTATGVFEVRDKTLGIIGYGHIGQQVSVLAEALGLRVLFYDKVKKLPIGNSKQLPTLDELLERSDIVTLHIPALPSARVYLGRAEIAKMKPGSYLLNSARGSLVDLDAAREALETGHLAGAAFDVFPDEPKSNQEPFVSDLCGMSNVILTPHIGGSTEEAQENIGREVAASFVNFIDTGSTANAVNFPQVDMPIDGQSHRILNIHKNVPGVLSEVNTLISELGANVNGQYLSTLGEVGYLVIDLNNNVSDKLCAQLSKLDSNIKTRILY